MTVTNWADTDYTRQGVFKRWARIDEPGGRSWKFLTHSLPMSDYVRFELEDITGWYGGVGVRLERTDRYGHGSFSSRGWRSERVMTLKASVICATADVRDLVERELSGILWDGEDGVLTVEESSGRELHTTVALDGSPDIVKVGTRALKVNIPLVSDDPFLYGPWREQSVMPVGAGVGFEFPPFSRDLGKGGVITFGAAIEDDVSVWNEGNADSAVQFEVVANSVGFALGLGNRRITYPWPTYPDIPLTVDMAGSLTVGGIDQTHLLETRQWSMVPPGGAARPFFELLNGGTGWATVRHRDTFI